jgi:uncharacterized protein
MPDFVDPYKGMTPDRPMTARELVRALRLNLAAELEAVHLYEAHADATDCELARMVLQDIANEERVHAGEFQRLIGLLLMDEGEYLAAGAAEVDEVAAALARAKAPACEEPAPIPEPGDREPTVGDLTETAQD